MKHLHAGAPWEILGLDFMGPYQPTPRRRNRYILTMVDHFTRLVVLVPCKRQTVESVVDALLAKWVAYYGVPRCIQSDQGTPFENDVMRLLLSRLEVRKTRTTAYRPQAVGRVERVNETLKSCITKFVVERRQEWDVLLPFVQMAINSAVHETTTYTPFFLAHGTEMQLPVDLAFPAPTLEPLRSASAYANELVASLETAFAWANDRQDSNLKRAKRRYDQQSRTIDVQVGDQVWLKKHTSAPDDHAKFYSRNSGPWTVTRRLGDVNIAIRLDADPAVERVTHVDRIRRKERLDDRLPDSDDEDSEADDDNPRAEMSRRVEQNGEADRTADTTAGAADRARRKRRRR